MTDTIWLAAAGVVFVVFLYVVWDAWQDRRRWRDPWRIGRGDRPYLLPDEIHGGTVQLDDRPFMPGRKDPS